MSDPLYSCLVTIAGLLLLFALQAPAGDDADRVDDAEPSSATEAAVDAAMNAEQDADGRHEPARERHRGDSAATCAA